MVIIIMISSILSFFFFPSIFCNFYFISFHFSLREYSCRLKSRLSLSPGPTDWSALMTSSFVLHVITTGCLFFFICLLMYNSYVYTHTTLLYSHTAYIFSSFCVCLYRFFFLSSSVQTIIIYPPLLLLLLHSRFAFLFSLISSYSNILRENVM